MKIILLLLISANIYSQSYKRLKPQYKDLSILNDKTCLAILKAISNKNNFNSSVYCSKKLYEQYIDSLTLYNFSSQPNIYKSDSKTSITTTHGDGNNYKMNEAEWLIFYKASFDLALRSNKYDTYGNLMCVPTNYEDVKYFYKKEKDKIKHYNNGRIKSYTYSSTDLKTKGLLFFHKNISPISSNSQEFDDVIWCPVVYYYKQPSKVVKYLDTPTLWVKKTGLPYTVAKELNLNDQRIEELFSLNTIITTIDCLDDLKTIKVSKDTINISFYDHSAEDNDIFKFTYNNVDTIILVKSIPIFKQLILQNKESIFELSAISLGNIGNCTVATKIEDKEYIFELKKDEKIFIYLNMF